jgi:histidinol-phosphatase (PHP family)
MLYNYHTHTSRCNHAVGTDREYVEKAIAAGIKTLGISDHAPYLFKNPAYYSAFRMGVDELHEYAESVRSLAKEYANDIRVLLGFELEYYPAFHKDEMAFLSAVSPDYCIMGQHFLGNEIGESYSGGGLNRPEQLTRYVSQVLEGLATGDFLYLAHPDLAGYRFPQEHIQTEYRRLCEGAKALKIPLEINLLGLLTGRHYPNETLFKIAAEVGNDVVIGVDAHDPQYLNDRALEKKGLDMAASLGLKLITTPFL